MLPISPRHHHNSNDGFADETAVYSADGMLETVQYCIHDDQYLIRYDLYGNHVLKTQPEIFPTGIKTISEWVKSQREPARKELEIRNKMANLTQTPAPSIDKLKEDVLDRLKSAQTPFELEKAKAIAQHIQWLAEWAEL